MTRSGERVRVPRDEIAEVQYAGVEAMVLGAVLVGGAVAFATYNQATCQDTADMYGRHCGTMGFLLMSPVVLTGGGLIVGGLVNYEDAKAHYMRGTRGPRNHTAPAVR
jgi:hypothetical protein